MEPQFANEFAFRFPVQNLSDTAATVRVRAIGCSCYRVMHNDTVLKVGSQISVPAQGEVVVDLHPPKPNLGDSPTYRVVLETVPVQGEAQLIELIATLRTIRDLRTNTGAIHQEFTEKADFQTARLEVMHSSRQRSEVDEPPTVTGWPVGARTMETAAVGEAVEEAGIWKRSYQIVAEIPPPDFDQNSEFRDVLTVHAAHLESQVQLFRRLKSGLSGPKLIHFGQLTVGATANRRMLLTSQDDVPFVVQGVEEQDTAIEMKVDNETPEKRHWLQFIYTGTAAGEHTQKLRVRTTHPQKSVFEIEVKANVVPQSPQITNPWRCNRKNRYCRYRLQSLTHPGNRHLPKREMTTRGLCRANCAGIPGLSPR